MSDIAVIYASHYGFTEAYARWLAEELAADLLEAGKVKREDLERHGTIVYGGGLYAGGLSGIQTIVKNYDAISNKRIILFSCGLADPEDPENVAHIEAGLEKVLTPEMREKIRQFHLRGGIDYSRLGLTHKAMMAMLRRVMLKKGYDNLRSEDQMMLDTYGGTVDFTNRESLAPLLNYVRSLP